MLRAVGERDEEQEDHVDAFTDSGFDPERWRDDPVSLEEGAFGADADARDADARGDGATEDGATEDGFEGPDASFDPGETFGDDDALQSDDPDWTPSATAAPVEDDGGAPAPAAGAHEASPSGASAPPGDPAGGARPAADAAQEGPAEPYPTFDVPRPPDRRGGAAPMRTGGRVTPHDPIAEKSVIAALLVSPDRIVEVSEIARPDDFFDRRNRVLFDAMIQLDAKGHVVDHVMLVSNLRATGELVEIGGATYLAEISQHATTSAHVKHHATLVAETSKLRSLIEASNSIIERAFETPPQSDEVQSLIDESESSIFSIAARGEMRGAAPVSAILDDVFHSIEAQRTRGEFTGIPSGFYDLDDILGGFNPGEMTVIAARPAMGKTAFVLNLMDYAVTRRADCLGRVPNVMFFSLEMGRASIVQRLLVSRAGVESHRLRQGKLHDREYADLVEAAGVLRDAGLFIDDTPGLSIMALRSRARRLKHEHGLDMIVIDYLQLLSAKAESRQQEISVISRSLKELARELEIPVITLAQLSRSVESREEKRPQLSDLRESGSIEQDADVVMMLYRAEYYFPIDENKGRAEVLIVKHRNGATGTVELGFQGAMLRFSNREPSMGEAIEGL